MKITQEVYVEIKRISDRSGMSMTKIFSIGGLCYARDLMRRIRTTQEPSDYANR